MPQLAHELYDVAIMGTGPAGLTAAIYTCRADLKTVMFEGDLPGGQLTLTSEVENFPGYENGIGGFLLIDEMRKQAQRFGAEIHLAMVQSIDVTKHPYVVHLSDGSTFETRTFIVASGASPRRLGLPGETRLWGYGVSSCATCDGAFYRDKEVVVVGGGDTAMEDATFLTKFAKKVTIVHRRDTLRASKIMQQRAMDNPKIEFLWHCEVRAVHGDKDQGVTGLTLWHNVEEREFEHRTDGLFLAIGHIPNTAVVRDVLQADEEGYIVTKPDSTKTNVPGVYAVGDVQDKVWRQAITAAGTGCMGALEAEHFLADLDAAQAHLSAAE